MPGSQELEHGLFTSDLSVNEFLLVKQVGFHPLGLVMGSSIYHIGLQKGNWGSSQELTKLTAAMYNARELAMNRMEEEADQLGADGVVGVRLDVNFYEWGHDSAEFIAVGTAVKAEDGNSYRNKLGKPFTSDLSGQDFWTLAQTGLHAPSVGHGHLRLPHRPPGDRPGPGPDRPKQGAGELHPSDVRRPRAGHEAYAGRGHQPGCHRCGRYEAGRKKPPVGGPHDRVPVARDGRRPAGRVRGDHPASADHDHHLRQLSAVGPAQPARLRFRAHDPRFCRLLGDGGRAAGVGAGLLLRANIQLVQLFV